MSYDKNLIFGKAMRECAGRLAGAKLLDTLQLASVLERYRNVLYTPGFFIRVGLFIFTFILTTSALGLFSMPISGLFDTEQSSGIVLLLYALLVLRFLEYMIRKKYHYRSGLDDCLLYVSVFFMITGVVLISGRYEPLTIALIAFPFLTAGAWRYADSFLALLAFLCLFTILFLVLKDYAWSRMALPFLFMAISAGFLYACNRFLRNDALFYYDFVWKVLKVCSLVTLYVSVNYVVVKEANLLLMQEYATDAASGATAMEMDHYRLPLSWFFLSASVLLPLVYIGYGLSARDRLAIWTGLALLVTGVLTMKYAYTGLRMEWVLAGGGFALLFGAWRAIRYLRVHSNAFTDVPDAGHDEEGWLNAEALLVAQTMGNTGQPVAPETGFGGGKFGGGGAGGSL